MAAPLPSAFLPLDARAAPVAPVFARPSARQRTAGEPAATDRVVLGIAALVLSTALFPMSDMLAKALSSRYPGVEVAWMRYAVLLAAIVPAMIGRPAVLRTRRPWLQFARGVSSAGATALALVGFVYLPVADATAIAFCAPMIVTGLAAVILKERVSTLRWIAAGVGFAGVLIIVRPGASGFEVATVLPLLSSICSALTVILTRLGRDERMETTLILTSLVGFALLTIPAALEWRTPSLNDLLIGFAMGALAAAATMLQLFAYRCASASLLAPFSYAQIVWAIAFVWLFTGAVPGLTTLAGSAVVIASGAAAGWGQSPTSRRRIDWRAVRRDLGRLQPVARQPG